MKKGKGTVCPACGYKQLKGNACTHCQTRLQNTSPGMGLNPPQLPSMPVRQKPPPPVSKDPEISGSGPDSAARQEPSALEAEDQEVSGGEPDSAVGQEVVRMTSPPNREKTPSLPRVEGPGDESALPTPQPEEISASLPRPLHPAKKVPAKERLEHLAHLIVTTTPAVEGWEVQAYLDIVGTSVLVRADALGVPLSASMERPFEKAKKLALAELKVEAARRGADAVVGLVVSQAAAQEGIWLHFMGTAVVLKKEE